MREYQRGSTRVEVQVWSTKVGTQTCEMFVFGATVNVLSSE